MLFRSIKANDIILEKNQKKYKDCVKSYIKELKDLQTKHTKEMIDSISDIRESNKEQDKCRTHPCKCGEPKIDYDDFVNHNDSFFSRCKVKAKSELNIDAFLFTCKECFGCFSDKIVNTFMGSNDDILRKDYSLYFVTMKCIRCDQIKQAAKLSCKCGICPECLIEDFASQVDDAVADNPNCADKTKMTCDYPLKCPKCSVPVPKDVAYECCKKKKEFVSIMKVISLTMLDSKYRILIVENIKRQGVCVKCFANFELDAKKSKQYLCATCGNNLSFHFIDENDRKEAH